MQKALLCPNCGNRLTVGEQIDGKVTLGLVGLAVGGKVDLRHPPRDALASGRSLCSRFLACAYFD